MLKSIIVILLLTLMTFSCGKKGCPKISEKNDCKEFFKKK